METAPCGATTVQFALPTAGLGLKEIFHRMLQKLVMCDDMLQRDYIGRGNNLPRLSFTQF